MNRNAGSRSFSPLPKDWPRDTLCCPPRRTSFRGEREKESGLTWSRVDAGVLGLEKLETGPLLTFIIRERKREESPTRNQCASQDAEGGHVHELFQLAIMAPHSDQKRI